MDNSVKIPKTVLHKLKKDKMVLGLIIELHRSTKDPVEFYDKCTSVLKTNRKIEEKLKNK